MVAGNLYEIGSFRSEGCRTTAEQLVAEYDTIVDAYETGPSFRIEIQK